MSISEKDVKAHEDRYKKLLYDKIGETISKQAEFIKQIGKTGQYIDVDTDLPNIGITFNNKLNELSQVFKKAGISMFAEPNEKYDFVNSNFVGDAIVEDMISQLSKGTQALSEYDSIIRKATKKKTEKVKALEETGPIKKLFLKLRNFFVPTTILNLISYSEDEIEEVNSHLSEYKEIDEKLWKYNLKDNVVQSLVNFINNRQYSYDVITGLLEKYVAPTLQKLGLEDVISQLKEELSKSNIESNTIFLSDRHWELSIPQKLEIQISSQQVANKFDINGSGTIKNTIDNKEENERCE